jgi:hypothetical protein
MGGVVRFLLIIQYDICLHTEVRMNAQLTSPSWKRRRLGSAMIIAGLSAMAMAGEAAADTYNFWLKSAPNTPYMLGGVKCAAGSFDFSKTGITSGSPVSNMTMGIAQNCIGPNLPPVNLTMTGSLSAVVRNINLNSQPQGPNMDGLTGTLTSQDFIKGCRFGDTTSDNGTRLARWVVTFSSAPGAAGAPGVRTYNLQEILGACTTGTPNFDNPTTTTLLSNKPYHVVNTLHAAPEPETLWLVALGGLGMMLLTRRKQPRA